MSPITGRISRRASCGALAAVRVSPYTSCPARRNAVATAKPTYPVAPVTNTRIRSPRSLLIRVTTLHDADYCCIMARESLRLSKSRFLAGLQCHKQLWWRVHEPDAPELVPDAGHRIILNQANEVGRQGRENGLGGTLVDLPLHQFDTKVARKRDLLQ